MTKLKVKMEECLEREETKFLRGIDKLEEGERSQNSFCQGFHLTYERCLRHEQSCKTYQTYKDWFHFSTSFPLFEPISKKINPKGDWKAN